MGDEPTTKDLSSEDTVAALDEMIERLASERTRRDVEALPPANASSRFQDLGTLGAGGMGQVLLVRDRMLRREAAMKVLEPGMSRSRSARLRFVEEAQIAGQLEHPSMVPVHELGVDEDGQLFFTMQVVRGSDLFSWSYDESRPVGSEDRLSEGLEIFLKLCDAVAYAHDRGVIHRDIKPSNVMVGEFGEVYLVDFGLARVVSEEQDDDASPSSVLGTAAYMPPEQAAGNSEQADERSDVFGLGAVLYHMVTGKQPYPGTDSTAVIEAARKGNYVPPEEALGGLRVSGQLLRIIKKAMHVDPDQRYASALELKKDARRFLRRGLHLPRRAYAPGDRIIVEGERGDEAFMLVSGLCEVYREVDGERKVIRRMGPGEVFGEMAILTEQERSASVEALEPTTVLVITRQLLAEELGDGSWLGTLLVSLARRFRDLENELARARSSD